MPTFIGDDTGKARKAKNIYVGVDGVARKAKKVYIGENGIARLVYTGEVLATFNGARNETLTFSNGQTVQTDGNGITPTIAIESGVLTVTGSVSGYSRTVYITAPGNYNAYPDGAIFWYGNGSSSGQTLQPITGWFLTEKRRPADIFSYLSGYVVDNSGAGYIGLRCTHEWSGKSAEGGSILTRKAVKRNGKNKLFFTLDASPGGESEIYMVAATDTEKFYQTAGKALISKKGSQTVSFNLSGNGDFFPGAYIWATGGMYGLPSVKIQAIWLE